jgi:hypothetical protein
MYIVAHGAAEVEISTVGVVGFYHQGDYFGEAALMRGEPRAATIRATQDLTVLRLGIEQFEPMKPLLTKARLKRFRRKPVEDKAKRERIPHVGFPNTYDETDKDPDSPISFNAKSSNSNSSNNQQDNRKLIRRTLHMNKKSIKPR